MSRVTVHGPEPITLEGRQGSRYWVSNLFRFTGDAVVDERLSAYPVAVFQPQGRPTHKMPVVVGLQGIAAPYQWNAFLVPTLLDMGIACVLFDTPLAGERSLARCHRGDIFAELLPFVERKVAIQEALVPLLMEAVARDLQIVLGLVRERHGLREDRVALFGVSLGTLLASFAFTRDGVGARLLGTLGHADLRRFARSYAPSFTSLAVSWPGRLGARLAALWFGAPLRTAFDFLTVLHELGAERAHLRDADPMHYADRVGSERRVRFLVGQEDRLVRPRDAAECAARFADGVSYAVPGLGHGKSRFGPSFVEHVRFFLGTQLSDWSW
jgi:hypothetical protein